jgi:hypothetical protein
MSKNRILAMVDERLRAQGQKAIDAEPTATAQPERVIKTMPGNFDVFTRSLDQPETAAPNDAELNRRARLAQTMAVASQSLTMRERYEAARQRMQEAGIYR